jgi:hypothetical protein
MNTQWRILTNCLGEIRISTEAYGIAVEGETGKFKCLWQTPVITMSKPPALPGDSQSLTFPGV